MAEPDLSRERIEAELKAAGGNRRLAAKSLGVSRATLYRYLSRYGLAASLPKVDARYQLERLIGTGSQAEVYEAVDTAQPNGSLCALKLLFPAESRTELERWRREARVLSTLRHPHLVAVHDLGIDRALDRAYLVMDRIRGRPFASAAAGMDWREVIRLFADVIRAVERLHRHGIVHRDLKSENVLVELADGDRPRAVVMDLGLSSDLTEAAEAVGGTMIYAAPELFDGQPASTRSDLYALGVLLYLSLTGRYPYQSQSVVELLQQAPSQTLIAASQLRPELPQAIDQLIARLIERDPSRRFPDAAAVLDAVHKLLGQTGSTRSADELSLVGRGAQIGEVVERVLAARDQALLIEAPDGMGKSRFLEACALEFKARARLVIVGGTLDQEAPANAVRIVDDLQLVPRAELASWAARLRASKPGVTTWLVSSTSLDAMTDQAAFLRGLSAEQLIARWSLPPLELAAVQTIATDWLGADRAAGLAHRLLEASGGRPLWVVLMLRALRAAERGADSQLPATLEELVARLLAALEPQALALVELLAIARDPLPGSWLPRLLQRPVAEGIAEGPAGEWISVRDERWSLAQPQLAGAIESRVAPTRRRVIHAALAEAWRDQPEALVRRAEHLLAAHAGGELDQDALAAIEQAADRLESQHAYRAQAIFLERVVQQLGADPAQRLVWLRRWERACLLARDIARGMEAANGSIAAASALGDRAAQARGWAQRASRLRDRAEWAQAHEAAERAISLADEVGESKVRSSTRNTAATIAWHSWDPARALTLFEQTAEIARAAGDRRMVAYALHNICLPRILIGHVAAGFEAIEQASSMFRELDDRLWGIQIENMRGVALTAVGDLEQAVEVLERAAADLRRLSPDAPRDHIFESLGFALLRLGRFDRAVEVGEQLIADAIRSGRPAGRIAGHLIVGRALLELDDGAAARAHHRLALDLAIALDEPRQRDFARIAVAGDRRLAGALDEARALAQSAYQAAEQTGNRRPLGLAALELAQIELQADDVLAAQGWLDRAEQSLSIPSEDAPARRALLQLARAEVYLRQQQWRWAEAAAREAGGLLARYGPQAEVVRLGQVELELAQARADQAAPARVRQRVGEQLVQIAGRIQDHARRGMFLARPDVARWISPSQTSESAEHVALALSGSALHRLYEIGRQIASEGQIEPLLQRIVEVVVDEVKADRGLLVLRESGTGKLYPAASFRVEETTAHDAISISHSVLAEASTGRAVLSKDALSDPHLAEAKSIALFKIRSLMCAPLRAGNEVLGTLYVDTLGVDSHFGPSQLRFLEAIADQAAVAISYARLLGQLTTERDRLRRAVEENHYFGSLVARSSSMKSVFELLERIADSSLPVIVTGESGTGKELVARALHYNSTRREKSFQSENCAAIPEPLLESLLFGHAKGAYTGADTSRRGLFELADGGTLFLDEIGDLSLPLQSKLLRVLQEGEIRPLGHERVIKVNVRIVTATHRDLPALIAEGKFRQDLYFRLNGVTVRLPPLRDRLEDVPLLAQHFLEQESDASGRPYRFDLPTLGMLSRHAWPGNVRELANVVKRLALLADRNGRIGLDALRGDATFAALVTGEGTRRDPQARTLDRAVIEAALAQCGGDRTKAAKLLGVSRATLYRRLTQLGID
jgi:transcriptional regulator with GAF, ATPase, and Fis domain/tetratricopeptide (TPR) repeat protein